MGSIDRDPPEASVREERSDRRLLEENDGSGVRILTLAQLRRRLVFFAALALLLTSVVWIAELAIGAFQGVTGWTAFAGLLDGVSLLTVVRWRSQATG